MALLLTNLVEEWISGLSTLLKYKLQNGMVEKITWKKNTMMGKFTSSKHKLQMLTKQH